VRRWVSVNGPQSREIGRRRVPRRSQPANGGTNAQAAARVGGLDTAPAGSAYFEFTIRPTVGSLTITGLGFGSRSTSTGPKAWTLRSDADSYGANLVTPGVLANDSVWAYRTAALAPPLTIPQDTPRTFRIYGYGGEGTIGANAANWRIDDLQVVPEPAAAALLSAALGALLLRSRHRRRPLPVSSLPADDERHAMVVGHRAAGSGAARRLAAASGPVFPAC